MDTIKKLANETKQSGNTTNASISGGGSGGGGFLIVEVDTETNKCDKTWAEVNDALANAVPCYFHVVRNQFGDFAALYPALSAQVAIPSGGYIVNVIKESTLATYQAASRNDLLEARFD